jgi:hypothetical protein
MPRLSISRRAIFALAQWAFDVHRGRAEVGSLVVLSVLVEGSRRHLQEVYPKAMVISVQWMPENVSARLKVSLSGI